MPYSSVLERASGTHKYSVQLKLGLLTSTCSVVCLLPQGYFNKLRLAALEVPGFIFLWCLGAQRKGMVINMKNSLLNRLSAFMLAALLCLSLTGCGGKNVSEDSSSAGDNTIEESADSGKNDVWVALSMNVDTLDLVMTTSVGGRQVALGTVWERLLTLNSQGEPVPELCESYEMSEDVTTFTFYLRQGVLFHDGSEMTADDVVASMNRWIETYSNVQELVGSGRFEKVDNYTVKITTDTPALTLPDMIAGATVTALITTADACADLTETGYLKNYVGTGPYKFTEFVQDQYIRLDRFDDYVPYGEDGYVDGMAGHKDAAAQTLYYSYVQEAATRIAGLQTGQYDLIYGLTSDNYDIIANTPGVETQTQEAGTLILVMNKKEGLCTDVNFRQAVNAALSMDDIMTVGYGSFYSLGSCYMDESNGFWLTDAGSENYNRSDLELAKKYLAQSSYQEGDVFTIMTTNENNRDKLALVIASQLEAIGITCDVQPYDYPTMNAYQSDPSLYDMFVISYSSVPLPTLKFYLGSGAGFWTTDETFQNYISCFNQATTKDEAYQIWEELQAYCWNDYLPVINCGHYQECYAWNADTLSNVNIYNNIAHMWSVSVN